MEMKKKLANEKKVSRVLDISFSKEELVSLVSGPGDETGIYRQISISMEGLMCLNIYELTFSECKTHSLI